MLQWLFPVGWARTDEGIVSFAKEDSLRCRDLSLLHVLTTYTHTSASSIVKSWHCCTATVKAKRKRTTEIMMSLSMSGQRAEAADACLLNRYMVSINTRVTLWCSQLIKMASLIITATLSLNLMAGQSLRTAAGELLLRAKSLPSRGSALCSF